MSQVLCYGSGLSHSLFALALKRFRKDIALTVVTNPRLPWLHERSADPGFFIVTPPLRKALEELDVWSKIAAEAAPVEHVHYYDCRSDEHFGTFRLSEICDGRSFRLLAAVSSRKKAFREELNKGFWTVSTESLKKAIADELAAHSIDELQGELQTITAPEESESATVATIQGKEGEQSVPFSQLIVTQYHCPLPKDLPSDPKPEATVARFRPVRHVPRTLIWDFRTNTDIVLNQPPESEKEWSRFRSSPKCILELWDRDQTRIQSSIRRTTADPSGPVGVRIVLRQQLATLLEYSMSKEGWNQVGSLTQFIRATDFASDALKCIWAYVVKGYELVQQRIAMKYEFVKRQMDAEDGRARRMVEKDKHSEFLFSDTHLARDWIHNTTRKPTLPPYVVPICNANASFIQDTFDLGLNHTLLEAIYAAKHWTPGGLPVGFHHHQFTKNRKLRRVLKKIDAYNYFKPWLIGKRLRIDMTHNSRLRKALEGMSDWQSSDKPPALWKRAFLE